MPSVLPWLNAHITWCEANFTWEDARKSEKYEAITTVIGKSNRKDILHLDSAYKEGCHIFLTSDNDDIASKKSALESICDFRIFFHKDTGPIIECLKKLLDEHGIGQ